MSVDGEKPGHSTIQTSQKQKKLQESDTGRDAWYGRKNTEECGVSEGREGGRKQRRKKGREKGKLLAINKSITIPWLEFCLKTQRYDTQFWKMKVINALKTAIPWSCKN